MIRKFCVGFFVLILALSTVGAIIAQEDTVITPDNVNLLSEIARLGRGTAEQLAFVDDGDRLAVISPVGVWLYDPGDLDSVKEPPLLPRQARSPLTGNFLATNNDGTIVAVAERDSIAAWNVDTGELLYSYFGQFGDGLQDFPTAIEVSPSNEGIIYGTRDGEILTVSFESTSAIVGVLYEGHSTAITTMLLNQDGTVLASGDRSGGVHLIDPGNGYEMMQVIEAHNGQITDLAYSPDGTVLATAGGENAVKLWDVDPNSGGFGTEIITLMPQDMRRIEFIAFSSDGLRIAAPDSNGDLYVIDADPNSETVGMAVLIYDETNFRSVADIAYVPYRNAVVAIYESLNVGTPTLIDLDGGAILAEGAEHTGQMKRPVFSPDGQTMVFGNSNKNVYFWDVAAQPALVDTLLISDISDVSGGRGSDTAFAPNGSFVAVVGGSDSYILDATTSEVIHMLDTGITGDVTISPDSSLVVFSGFSGIQIFDAESGELLRLIDDPSVSTSTIGGGVFSPDGTIFAIAASDGTMRVFAIRE